MLRSLLRDFRQFPATMALCSLWVLVYVLMVLTGLWHGGIASWKSLLMGSVNGHRFGDLTAYELFRGEVWRPLTATFVHFGVVHLGLNLFGMYQLGCLVESWYGPGQLLLLYVLIGTGGNTISGLIRRQAGLNPYIHSGGGSTVLLGLVALCAVVGWRSRSRIGDYLKNQMLLVLALTAVLGFFPFIDNWGHVGGALCGAALGFAHRFLVRNAERPAARWAGLLGALALLAGGAAQYHDDRAEVAAARARLAVSERTVEALVRVEQNYFLALPRPARHGVFMPKQARDSLANAVKLLDLTRAELDRGPTAGDFRGVRALLERARAGPPTPADLQAFELHLRRLAQYALAVRNTAQRDYQALALRR